MFSLTRKSPYFLSFHSLNPAVIVGLGLVRIPTENIAKKEFSSFEQANRGQNK